MADLTATTEPSVSAWILKRTSNSPRYSVRIDVGSTTLGAIEEGQWVVVLDDGANVTEVGRILRIRSDLDSATIHFDHWQAVEPSMPLAVLGLTAPTGPVARLPWDEFLRILPLLGVSAPGAVPLIDDVVYTRDLLELAVRDDLLGPAGGPHELIKDMSVRDRYLVGKLAPRRPDDDQAARIEPASAAEEAGDLEDERTAPLHEPGAEFASASGRVEPEDDALDEIDTTNNQSLVPSSMGLTFCVAPDVGKLAVDARWGRYERVPNDEHDIVKTRKNRQTGHQEEVKVRVWQRIPCGGVVTVPLVDGPIKPSTPDPDQPDVQIGRAHV